MSLLKPKTVYAARKR